MRLVLNDSGWLLLLLKITMKRTIKAKASGTGRNDVARSGKRPLSQPLPAQRVVGNKSRLSHGVSVKTSCGG
jgi:hypothetical protein